jgi:uncharacterized protein (TIGR00645 family)
MVKSTRKAEQLFEALLWKSRLIIILAVIFGVLASAALFLTGSYEIWHTVTHILPGHGGEPDYSKLLIGIIGAVDLYLIGIVLLIFSFGIYELFISDIDAARQGNEKEHNNILEITSLDELKNKLLKVVIMVLIVTFFKSVLSAQFQTPLEILYFGVAILAVAVCSYFIRNIESEK